MRHLLRMISLRHMLGSPLRSVLTVLGVAVGVSTMVGITAINRTVLDSFRSTVDTIAGKADLTITGAQTGFDDSLVEKVKQVSGVLHASGGVSAIAPVQGAPGVSLYVMGVDVLDDGHFRTYEGADRDLGSLADDLEFLNSTDRMLVSERFARERGLKLGDAFKLITSEGAQEFIVHGLLKEKGPVKAFGGSVGIMYVGSAQEAFHRGRNIDRIDVGVDPALGADRVRQSLVQALGSHFEVERPERRGGSVEKMVLSFQMGLNLGSAVALLVGMFLVYNTVSIGVLQRRREIGALRALGATRLGLRSLFTLEAAVLGSIGTLLGLPFGVVVAKAALRGVTETISALYVNVNASDLKLGAVELSLGVAMGVLGSVFAALRPAIVASRVQPVEALRRDLAAGASIDSLRSTPTLLGSGLLLLTWPISKLPAPMENLPVGGYLAIFCVLMGTTLLTPMMVRSLRPVYAPPFRWLFGVSGRIAADNFARAPVRTAVPVSALSIGVAMTVCIAGFVGSFRASAERWLTQSVPADLFVTSAGKLAGVRNTPMNKNFGDELAKIAGVAEVDHVRIYPHDVLGLRVFIVSVVPEIYDKHGSLYYLEGKKLSPREREEGMVTISENLARRRELQVGSRFEMNTPTGTRTYTVGAIARDYTSDQGTIFFERRIFSEHFNDELVDTFEIYLSDKSRLEEVRSEVTRRYGAERDLYVLSNFELRHEAMALIDGAFAVTYAMEVVAVLLALLGVINTLLAAVLDRTREIGLLRAVGASRRHVMRLFSAEAALIGLAGGLLGVLSGIATGLVVTDAVGVESTGWAFSYVFPWQIALQMLVISGVCAVIAGLHPARRASKLDVVEAVAYE